MDCPQCGGPAYDNREKVANGWKGPLAKCKDQDGCGWKKWAPKGQRNGSGGGGGNGNRGQGASNGAGPRNSRPLGPLYFACMGIASESVKRVIGDKATAADVIAATATLFIAANQSGAPLRPVPKPKPEPEPVYEEQEEGSEEADLPF